jgi:hypothetical protein
MPHQLDPDEDRCCKKPTLPKIEPKASGSRRRRLWELGSHTHCPVIGMCLPMAALRRVADKALGGQALADDYELHCGTVAECQRRSRLADALQRELDRRYLLQLRAAAGAKTSEALAEWWQAQAHTPHLPGALWATLTHPRCTPAIEHHVLGQVHMLQHQVGMATRVELARFEALIDENAVLARELGAAQRRASQQAAAHEARAEALQAEAVRLRGQLMARDGLLAQLRDELDQLHSSAPDLASRQELARQNAGQAERITELRRALQAARSDLERLRQPPAAPRALPEVVAEAQPPQLANRAVLCVGGRTASVPVYRRLVEDHGGRFLHHDGGEEHNVNQLDATLAAADLVICQAGCVSHGAYWRVKDHCKRTGKRCVFVETPSASGLQRALATIDDQA